MRKSKIRFNKMNNVKKKNTCFNSGLSLKYEKKCEYVYKFMAVNA